MKSSEKAADDRAILAPGVKVRPGANGLSFAKVLTHRAPGIRPSFKHL